MSTHSTLRARIVCAFLALLVLTPVLVFSQDAAFKPTVVAQYDFESGGTQGWGPRGDGVSVRAVADAAHSGKLGLIAAGRSATWMGSAINIVDILKQGVTYEVTAWLRLASAPSTPSTVKFTMEEKSGGGTGWVQVAGTEIKDDKWVKVTGKYSFSKGMDALTLYAESSSASDVIYSDDITITMMTPPPAAPAVSMQKDLKGAKEALYGFFALGTAVGPHNIKGPIGDLVVKHFNSIVAENAMKPAYIQPSEGVFFWDEADAIVKFAKSNGMVLRYHTLQWHEQSPAWFFQDKNGKEMVDEKDPAKRAENKKLLLQRLDTHVRTVVSRYKNDIGSWDVVNEVIDASQSDGMRQSKWYLIAGKDFVETAFRAAREAGGPSIKLFINDFNTHDPAKRDALAKLIKELKAKGVSITGVGHQTHINALYPPMNQIIDSIKLFAGMGLDNQITELDISVYSDNLTSYGSVPEELLVKNGYRYKELFDELKKVKNMVSNVTIWGINDGTSWLQNRPINRVDAPLLFTTDLKAKYAYWAIVDPSKLPPPPPPPAPKAAPKVAEAINGKAVIDGKIEAAWNKAKSIDVSVALGNQKPATGKARIMWDTDFLYVLFEVADPLLNDASTQVHEQDSIEIFMDENKEKTATYQGDDGQYRINYKNKASFGSNGASKDMTSAVTITQNGYLVEAAIPFRTIKGAVGTVIGFDAQVNDADASGKRIGVSKWNDDTDESWRNTLNFGELKFVK